MNAATDSSSFAWFTVRCPIVCSTEPRLFCTDAQSKGAISRVNTVSAALIGADSFLERGRRQFEPALVVERVAEIELARRPLHRELLLGAHFHGGAEGGGRGKELAAIAQAVAQRVERVAEIVLRHRPLHRRLLAGIFLKREAIGLPASSSRALLPSRSPSV